MITDKNEFEKEKKIQNKTNSSVKIKILCGRCKKEIFKIDFSHFKNQNKKQCNECGRIDNINNQRFTINYIKHWVEKHSNCKLLSTIYKNIDTKLKFKCECGNKFFTTFYNFKHGKKQCNHCGYQITSEKVTKYNKNTIIKILQNFNYELLSEFKDINTSIKIRCDKGHIYESKFKNFLAGCRCPICGEKTRIQKKTLTYNYIKNFIEKEGYILLSDTYIKAKNKLKMKCPKGHIFKMSFNDFKYAGSRCPICANIQRGLSRRIKDEEIIKQIHKKLPNYKILNIYRDKKNNKTRILIEYICENGHHNIQYWGSIKTGHKCLFCQYDNIRGENHPNWKNGCTTEHDKIRHSYKYKKWRQKIYKRDNYTCQCCGDDKGGNLNAHHILNFAEYKDLRFNINNGITLCNKCHMDFHKKHGFYNNTKEQLDKYIYENNKINKKMMESKL